MSLSSHFKSILGVSFVQILRVALEASGQIKYNFLYFPLASPLERGFAVIVFLPVLFISLLWFCFFNHFFVFDVLIVNYM